MHIAFFPDPVFGWAYCATLVCVLAVAAFTDLRRMLVPKWLTLSALALGIVANIIRGGCLGSAGGAVWSLGAHGTWVGMLDGLMFAGAGFLLGFGLLFVLWILGTCGGGDVKLFAALGAWIGPVLAVTVLTGTIFMIALMVVARLLSSFFTGGFGATFKAATNAGGKKASRKPSQPPKKRLITYSLPVAVVTALVLLWVFRIELRIAPAKEASGDRIHAQAR